MTAVSIVIPCFNHAPFLGEAIESACRQDWPDVEVIVVDDGSTDESRDVAGRFPGVRLIAQRNRGVAEARNAGFRAADGDILIFLDADDRLRPGAARAAVTAFGAHEHAVMVFGRCQLIDATGAPLPTSQPPVRADYYKELLRRNYVWMPAMAAYRRFALEAAGPFDATVNPSADYDMYLRVAARWAIAGHDAVVADYRQHGANMSGDPVLMLDTTLAVMRRQWSYVRHDAELRAAYHEGVARWRAFYGEHVVTRFRAALHERRFAAASVEALQLLRLYPRGVAEHLRKKAALLRAASL